MSKKTNFINHFRSFCAQNNITDIVTAVEYFSVFGGMGWSIDTSKPLETLIEEKIFKNYKYIHGDITKITNSNPIHHKLLSALAIGDRREHSAFKRAKVGRFEGEKSIDFLIEKELLESQSSIMKPYDEFEEVSIKLNFKQPFMKFWFANVSPYYKGIKDGNYKEAQTNWENIKNSFFEPTYNRLVIELIKESYVDEKLEKIGSYWDLKNEIEILAKTKSGKLIAGATKFSKAKASKSDLTRLKESCRSAQLEVENFVIFSKNKFSSELKSEKGGNLLLFSLRNLTPLIENLTQQDILLYTNKKY